MKIHPTLAAALLSLPTVAASAAPNTDQFEGFVDVFYAPSSTLTITGPGIEGDMESDGGTGFGLRGRMRVTPTIFLRGEVQQDSYDGFEGETLDTDAGLLRLGAGLIGASGFYGTFEFVKEELNIDATPVSPALSADETGYALHLGIERHPGSPKLTLFGEIGYNDVGDFGNGVDLNVGAAYQASRAIGVLADYRLMQQKDDSDTQGKFEDIRLGARIVFGD